MSIWGLEYSRRESNPHPLHWKCNAQPLCYCCPLLLLPPKKWKNGICSNILNKYYDIYTTHAGVAMSSMAISPSFPYPMTSANTRPAKATSLPQSTMEYRLICWNLCQSPRPSRDLTWPFLADWTLRRDPSLGSKVKNCYFKKL